MCADSMTGTYLPRGFSNSECTVSGVGYLGAEIQLTGTLTLTDTSETLLDGYVITVKYTRPDETFYEIDVDSLLQNELQNKISALKKQLPSQ